MATTNIKSDADADADGPSHPPRADAHEHSADGPLRSSSILALLPDELLSRVLGFKIGSLRELTRLGTVSPAFRVARYHAPVSLTVSGIRLQPTPEVLVQIPSLLAGPSLLATTVPVGAGSTADTVPTWPRFNEWLHRTAPSVQALRLQGCNIDQASLVKLLSGLPLVESLHLSKCFSVDGQRLLQQLGATPPPADGADAHAHAHTVAHARAHATSLSLSLSLRCISFSDLPKMHLATLPSAAATPAAAYPAYPLPRPSPRLSALGRLSVLGFTNCVLDQPAHHSTSVSIVGAPAAEPAAATDGFTARLCEAIATGALPHVRYLFLGGATIEAAPLTDADDEAAAAAAAAATAAAAAVTSTGRATTCEWLNSTVE